MTPSSHTPVDAGEFERRLVKLCLAGGGPGLPKRARDRRIVLKAATLGLDAGRTYTEREINQVLEAWLREVGPAMESDHVSLRRALVDERYLERGSGGEWYRLGPASRAGERFTPEVDGIDPARAIRDAQAERERRRRAHASGAGRGECP